MDAARLKSIPLFAALSERERDLVARWADEVDVKEGKRLVDQGSFAYEFFVIEKGRADVVQGEEKLTELGPGDFFGEIALTTGGQRTASVIAKEPMTLIVMHGRYFNELEQAAPSAAAMIKDACTERAPR